VPNISFEKDAHSAMLHSHLSSWPLGQGNMDMQTSIANIRSFWIGVLVIVIITFAVQLKFAVASEKIKGDTMDLVSVAGEIKGEIVQIVVPLPNGKSALGSGFWVHQSGYVATCWHVVRANPEASLTVQSAVEPLFDLKNNIRVLANWDTYSAKLVAKDEINDLAILKIEGRNPLLPGKSGLKIKIGDKELTAHYRLSVLKAELPEPGQRILLAGYPLGQPYQIVQEGIVASVAGEFMLQLHHAMLGSRLHVVPGSQGTFLVYD